jgi:hypothetical protein
MAGLGIELWRWCAILVCVIIGTSNLDRRTSWQLRGFRAFQLSWWCLSRFFMLLIHAPKMSATKFYQYCQVPPSARDEILCRAYVNGLIAGLTFGKDSMDNGIKILHSTRN